MELNLSSSADEYNLKKNFFNIRPEKDELILQVHHSYTDSLGEKKRYRFIHASFNEYGTQLAVSDHKGHVFIIDLESEKYWELPDVGFPTLISFPPLKPQELLISINNCSILFVNIESDNMTGVLYGHSVPATEVSYSDNGCHYLTSCTAEAIIWDSSTLIQIHRLSLKSEVLLRKVLFMPVTNHIFACFQDNTMSVWNFKNFECIKQIIPDTWKTHSIRAIALTKNGRAMVIGGHSPSLVVFCLDTWAVMKMVEFPEHISGVKQMEFISQVFDGGANKILILLTTSNDIFFFDIETSVFLRAIQQISGMAVKFALSSNGKHLATTLTTGKVNIYVIEKILSSRKHSVDLKENFTKVAKNNPKFVSSSRHSLTTRRTSKSVESLGSIQKQIKEVLDVKKLIPLLKQYGEYPETYRVLIWKVILQLPANQESFVSLSSKNCHPSYAKIEANYPLINKSLRNSLKKVLSNLAHWCPLFGEVDFIPEFTFPFVKLFHSDPLASFEVVATIIVNWCQNWFEFFPFPPINMLSVMENILGCHDPGLLEFYLKNNITSSVFVCPLFHSVFSEVLSKSEWLKLWDHVLSNEPSFLFMAIIAYNVVCRNAIFNFRDPAELEKFFHKQNPVDMKLLITKTYHYLKETPEEIHSRQFLRPFQPLSRGGTYSTFLAYPKLIVDQSSEKLQTIRKEEDNILEEQLKALSIKKKLEKKLKSTGNGEEQKKIFMELEEKIRKTVEEEEERVLVQRKRLQNLKHELRIKELEVLEDVRDKALEERLKRKEMEFERLLKEISKRRAREKMEVDVIEEEIRKYYSELLLRKCQLEMELGFTNEPEFCVELGRQHEKLENDLAVLQDEWNSLQQNKRIDFSNKVASARILMNDLETDAAKKLTEKNSIKQSEEYREFLKQLKAKVKILEDEIEKLLNENLSKLKEKKQRTRKVTPRRATRPRSTSFSESDKPNAGYVVRTPPSNALAGAEGGKYTGNSKVRPAVKPSFRKLFPASKKISTVYIKFPKSPSPSEVKDKECKACKQKSGSLRDLHFKKKKTKLARHKSKFTCLTCPCPKPTSESLARPKSKTDVQSNDSEKCCELKKSQQRPRGDCVHDGSKARSRQKSNQSELSTEKDSAEFETDSENEIFKSVMRARQQMIDEAKLRQKLG